MNAIEAFEAEWSERADAMIALASRATSIDEWRTAMAMATAARSAARHAFFARCHAQEFNRGNVPPYGGRS